MKTQPLNKKSQAFGLALFVILATFFLTGCMENSNDAQVVFKDFYDCIDEGVPMLSGNAGPSRNDVSIRTLRIRPEHDVFDAIDHFYATRLDWAYLKEADRENVVRVKSMDVRVGGAAAGGFHTGLNNNLHSGDEESEMAFKRSLAIVDLNGNPIVVSWKRTMAAVTWEADPTNPSYFEAHLAYLKGLVDLGCESIQRDEADMGTLAADRFGGGFSPSGIASFREWMMKNISAEKIAEMGIQDVENFDYKQYLIEKGAPAGDAFKDYDCPVKETWVQFWDAYTKDFWQRMLAEIKQYAKERNVDLQISCNNSSLQLWTEVVQIFDFGMSELMAGSAWPGHLHNRARVARSHEKHQMFNTPKCNPEADFSDEERTILTRKVIATSYSLGMTCQVPWDKWNHSDARYFGKPSDYADLYAFIRANNWSGYVEAAAIGPEIEQRSGKLEQLMSFEGGNGYVYGFLNLHHEDAQQPLLLFLVDWGKPLVERPPVEEMEFLEEGAYGKRLYFSPMGLENLKRTDPESFEIHFSAEAFPVTADRLVFTLLEPKAYDPNLHRPASEVNDYSDFVQTAVLRPQQAEDGKISLKIPQLSPWGVVQISLQD